MINLTNILIRNQLQNRNVDHKIQNSSQQEFQIIYQNLIDSQMQISKNCLLSLSKIKNQDPYIMQICICLINVFQDDQKQMKNSWDIIKNKLVDQYESIQNFQKLVHERLILNVNIQLSKKLLKSYKLVQLETDNSKLYGKKFQMEQAQKIQKFVKACIKYYEYFKDQELVNILEQDQPIKLRVIPIKESSEQFQNNQFKTGDQILQSPVRQPLTKKFEFSPILDDKFSKNIDFCLQSPVRQPQTKKFQFFPKQDEIEIISSINFGSEIQLNCGEWLVKQKKILEELQNNSEKEFFQKPKMELDHIQGNNSQEFQLIEQMIKDVNNQSESKIFDSSYKVDEIQKIQCIKKFQENYETNLLIDDYLSQTQIKQRRSAQQRKLDKLKSANPQKFNIK